MEGGKPRKKSKSKSPASKARKTNGSAASNGLNSSHSSFRSAAGTHPTTTTPIVAKRIRVYRNGDQYHKGITVVLNIRHVHDINALLDAISEKIGLVGGAKKLYTLNGQLVKNTSSLENNREYVASSGGFVALPYGQAYRQQQSAHLPRKEASLLSMSSKVSSPGRMHRSASDLKSSRDVTIRSVSTVGPGVTNGERRARSLTTKKKPEPPNRSKSKDREPMHKNGTKSPKTPKKKQPEKPIISAATNGKTETKENGKKRSKSPAKKTVKKKKEAKPEPNNNMRPTAAPVPPPRRSPPKSPDSAPPHSGHSTRPHSRESRPASRRSSRHDSFSTRAEEKPESRRSRRSAASPEAEPSGRAEAEPEHVSGAEEPQDQPHRDGHVHYEEAEAARPAEPPRRDALDGISDLSEEEEREDEGEEDEGQHTHRTRRSDADEADRSDTRTHSRGSDASTRSLISESEERHAERQVPPEALGP